jgi:hypothetical protein
MFIVGARKHGLSSLTENSEPKKTKREEPQEVHVASYSGIGSLVDYGEDDSSEEEVEQPAKTSKQNERRLTARTKKQQNLPFWAVGK